MAKPKVMVAVCDTHSVESLTTLACQLVTSMGGELTALHVVEIPPATPLGAEDEILDHPGKELLSVAKRVAGRFSVPITTQLVRAREVGEVIVDEAKVQGMDLLVMGHRRPGHHPLGEILLGSTVHHVAHHTPCRVIVQILPPEHS
jgi:nucleotide-binding universal stress UspA family protein